MPVITAQLVNELRSKTGLGMMECKRALAENDGDVAKAIDYFRKKGVKASITERTANEGRLHAESSSDRKTAAIVVVNCNTDFTAKSEPVTQILKSATAALLKNPTASVADDASVNSEFTAVAQKTGENVQIGRTAVLKNPEGTVGTYVYQINSKIGVLMSVTGTPSDEVFKQLGGHIAFAKPLGLTRAEVPADLVAKEREIAVEQAKATGKPQEIAEKIAEGKLNSFFAERVLLDQEFFNPAVFKGSVQNYLKQSGLTLVKYERLEVGQQ
ncbi:translation elongation factor Ts [soil metagenome]